VPWLKPVAAVLAVAGFVLGSAVGLYRFRQEMRRPIDEGAPHPEDSFRDEATARERRGRDDERPSEMS
jgi:membrane-associated protein